MKSFENSPQVRNTFESNEFKLRWKVAVQEFSEAHQYLKNQKSAAWKCIEISWEFIKFLNDKNVITPKMLEEGTVGVHHEIVNDVKHTVVRVGDTLIDWTRRQFEPESEFPYIYSIQE